MQRVYGIWEHGGWLETVNGEPIHSLYPQVLAARIRMSNATSAEVREIGLDGLPGEKPTSDNVIHFKTEISLTPEEIEDEDIQARVAAALAKRCREEFNA